MMACVAGCQNQEQERGLWQEHWAIHFFTNEHNSKITLRIINIDEWVFPSENVTFWPIYFTLAVIDVIVKMT